ncbi:bifunctional isochorismate lyase / aryl carrier protein [Sinosporangium album]|uniref:Bifunctional isochorismate lyase / aryl carrier protein n=1 Tax=Sinosporangium album TaxID=504805 RepID=A0A1G8HN87_9ACTN|nr:isochorismatase family protein [Sinosporangium album]SDI08143.1 bifunctional isochorismate lyase / aryl carrier protein [Sinosporangium album]
MAIPTIAPYAMPRQDDLPSNRVTWRPDADRAVLLVHDMQNYFLSAYTPGEAPLPELTANINLLRRTARDLGVPVVYSAQPGAQTREQRGLLLDFWGDGIGPDPLDAAIHPDVAPGPGDTLVTKWRYSAFHRTELGELMDRTGRDQLLISGVYTHIGCLMTACDAFMNDTQAFLIADATADFSADHHRKALTYAAERCAVVTPTRSLVSQLTATGVPA